MTMRVHELADLGTLSLPYKGSDFPRHGIPITPEEILDEPYRVIGRGISVNMVPTGETVLRQPRLETTKILMTEMS